ncbi:MAG: hypothetical protein KC432_04135 [Thermomicrobiales bacterium]|nr:hypothetical protein [Thermomicrobiales bacterium]
MVNREGKFPDWPQDDSVYPDDEKLPWAREVLRQNSINPERDEAESRAAFRARLTAEAIARGWEVDAPEPSGSAFSVVMRNAALAAAGRDLRGYGATPDAALIVALADAITLDNA